MVIGIGLDIVEIRRITHALQNGQTMMKRVFTPKEILYCSQYKNQFQHFAGRFAAKEAALKALGTGWQKGIRWKDVEITNGGMGKPELTFYGRAEDFFAKSGSQRVLLSITHATDYAVAMVVLES